MRRWASSLIFLTTLLWCQVNSLRSENDLISLAFVGDVMVAGSVGRRILKEGTDYPLAKVKSILSSADIAFCNLEVL